LDHLLLGAVSGVTLPPCQGSGAGLPTAISADARVRKPSSPGDHPRLLVASRTRWGPVTCTTASPLPSRDDYGSSRPEMQLVPEYQAGFVAGSRFGSRTRERPRGFD